ncbi:phage tail protein, partial [Cupriavidus gilardii]
MATIDFLPFATGSGANVMSQAEWAALTQRLSGFQSGVAQSA